MLNSDQDAASVRSNTSDISAKKKSYRTKIYENQDRIEKYKKTKTWSIILCNMTLKTEFAC